MDKQAMIDDFNKMKGNKNWTVEQYETAVSKVAKKHGVSFAEAEKALPAFKKEAKPSASKNKPKFSEAAVMRMYHKKIGNFDWTEESAEGELARHFKVPVSKISKIVDKYVNMGESVATINSVLSEAIEELNEKVNVAGARREEASVPPGKKLTKEFKQESQEKVDANTKVLLKEIDSLVNEFESFRNKFKKVVGDEGSRRQKEGLARFGGRWSKLKTMYGQVENLVVKLQDLKFNR